MELLYECNWEMNFLYWATKPFGKQIRLSEIGTVYNEFCTIVHRPTLHVLNLTTF